MQRLAKIAASPWLAVSASADPEEEEEEELEWHEVIWLVNDANLKVCRDNATVTQLAEYLFCKQTVVGSSPTCGSTL